MKIFINMIFLHWKVISVILSLLFISCTYRITSTEEFNYYLKETFQRSISTNELYILLPLNTCSSCLKQTKSFLLEQSVNYDIHLVLLSKTNREAAQYAEHLDKKFTVLVDSKGSIYNHPELAKNLPVLIQYNDKKSIVMPFNINTNFEEMKQIILSFYKE